MSHSVTVTLVADQVIKIKGHEVNIHDLEAIRLNDEGEIVKFSLHDPLALPDTHDADGMGVCEKCGTRSVLWKCRVCGHDNRPTDKA